MHAPWRATLVVALLAAASAGSFVLALALTRQQGLVALVALSWAAALLVTAAGLASWLQYGEMQRLRRSLGMGLTHNLRTSLAQIQTFNEMLLLGKEGSEEERMEWLEVVGREAQRLGLAVENLLFLFRDGDQSSFPVRREVDLGALLEDVASAQSTRRDGRSGGDLVFEVDPPSGIVIKADPTGLRQALDNLFESAVRAAPPGATISGTVGSDGSVATVMVLIEPAKLAAVGDGSGGSTHGPRDFRRRVDDDLGLEMAVVHHVARMHGGRAAPAQLGPRTGYRVDLPVKVG